MFREQHDNTVHVVYFMTYVDVSKTVILVLTFFGVRSLCVVSLVAGKIESKRFSSQIAVCVRSRLAVLPDMNPTDISESWY